jgi:hypothetical protein
MRVMAQLKAAYFNHRLTSEIERQSWDITAISHAPTVELNIPSRTLRLGEHLMFWCNELSKITSSNKWRLENVNERIL